MRKSDSRASLELGMSMSELIWDIDQSQSHPTSPTENESEWCIDLFSLIPPDQMPNHRYPSLRAIISYYYEGVLTIYKHDVFGGRCGLDLGSSLPSSSLPWQRASSTSKIAEKLDHRHEVTYFQHCSITSNSNSHYFNFCCSICLPTILY